MGRIDIAVIRNPHQSDYCIRQKPISNEILYNPHFDYVDWQMNQSVRIDKPKVQHKGMWRDGIFASKISLK
jgi:hypothetical protein